MRPRTAIACLAALVLAMLPGTGNADGPDATAHGVTSANVEHVKFVPFEVGTATGARIVDNYLYLTSWKNISIYSLTNPLDPQLVSITPLGFQFENEDVATNGKIMLFSESLPGNTLHIWDVTNKAAPVEIARVSGAGNHTTTCVQDCQFAYGSSGTLTDMRVPAQAAIVGNWASKSGASGGHDVREVGPGIVHVASGQAAVLDTTDPLNPKRISIAGAGGPKPAHSSTWPNNATDKFLLGGSETNATVRCGTSNGATSTYDMTDFRSGTYRFVDSFRASSGILFDGNPVVNGLGCSAHWLEAAPSFRNGGIFAQGYYEHGTRFFYVNGAGKLRQVGFFTPFGGSTSAAYWVTDRIVYAIDYTRGIDILRWNGPFPADPDASNDVTGLTASATGSVSGVASFLGETTPTVLATDPLGDSPGGTQTSDIGVDITEANVFQPDADYPELVFTWKVSNLPNPVTGMQPENVRYVWTFAAGGRDWFVQAKASALAQSTTADDPTGAVNKVARAFQLRGNCALIGGVLNNCGHVAWLDGSFDIANKSVSVRVPIGASFLPGVVPGATLAPTTSPADDIYAALQVVADTTTTRDTVAYETPYTIPQRTVQLGVAAAGTDPSQVSFGPPIVVGADGAFSGNVGPVLPGHHVFAKACFGTTCAVRSTAAS